MIDTEARDARRYGRPRQGWIAAGVILAALAGGLTLWLLLRSGNSAQDLAEFADTRHVNEAGGYSFRYPEEWALEEAGTITKIRSPGREISISFGIAPSGSLIASARELAQSVRAAYVEGELLAAEAQEIGGRRAVLTSGTGINEAGIAIRFLAITVKGPGQNYAITVFTARDSDPLEVLPVTQEVVASFRVHRGSF